MQEFALRRKMMSSFSDRMTLKFLAYIQIEGCVIVRYMSPEFRKEVWIRNLNFGFINL